MNRGRRISIVTPVHDEADNVRALVERIASAMKPLPYEYDVIVVDDGSAQRTRTVLDEVCSAHANVGVLQLSRNFGHQAAVTAGLDHARGDAVVVMDADLQHPPELLPELIAQWEAGADVVYTVRTDEQGRSLAKGLSSRLFYKVLARVSEVPVPADAADFRLMDRSAADALGSLRERTRFLRGLSAWIGFAQTPVRYVAAERRSGETKFTLRRMLGLAGDGLLSMSTVPLRIALLLGFLLWLPALAYGAYVVFAYFFTNRAIKGWSSLIVAVVFLGGLQISLLGVVGLYIAKIYDEVKQRPLYIVRRRLGRLGTLEPR